MDAEMVDPIDEAGDDASTPTSVRDESPATPAGVEQPAASSAGPQNGPAEEAVEHDIQALLAEREQYKDIAMRLQADFENYRKRQQANLGDEIERATGRLVEQLLPVLDACELAFSHGADGVEPIWSALIGTLQRQGLEALDLQGKPFDPAEAEAVVHEPGDSAEEPVVVDVMRTGYRWKGRVIRPAMVRVKG